MVELYVVTAMVRGEREIVTKPFSKRYAKIVAQNLRNDNKIAIPKYKWATNIRIKKVKV